MSGVKISDSVCPECGIQTGESYRLTDPWLSAWRLAPLGLVCCILAWMVVSGQVSVETSPGVSQTSVLVPIVPPRVVGDDWAPMLTLRALRAIADGSERPDFRVSDVRPWKSEVWNDGPLDETLHATLLSYQTAVRLSDEVRFGWPCRLVTVSKSQGSHRLCTPLVRRERSRIANWTTIARSFAWAFQFEHADGRITVVELHYWASLFPIACGALTCAVLRLVLVRQSFRHTPRRLRSMILGLVLLMYFIPTWTFDQATIVGPTEIAAPTKLKTSQVYALPDSPEGARSLAAAMSSAISATMGTYWSDAVHADDVAIACCYWSREYHETRAKAWYVRCGDAQIACRWTMRSANESAIGSWWNVSEHGKLTRRVQRPDSLEVTTIDLGMSLLWISIVLAPLYLSWIARRLWLNRLSQNRRYAKQCVACGYQIIRTSES